MNLFCVAFLINFYRFVIVVKDFLIKNHFKHLNLMNFPFYKNSSFKFAQNLSDLDVSLRGSQTKLLPEGKVSGHLSKVLVHLAWPKDHARGFCEADEVAFYLICGKWGKPTKISQKNKLER
jgi:hypothetical protein